MNKKAGTGKVIIWIVTTLLIVYFMVFGVHIVTTDNGNHTGQVTAIETNGIFFKTDTVYFKSDVSSSQEDRYCVIDSKVKEKLNLARQSQKKVTIVYMDYFISGWRYCSSDTSGIILGVS